MLDDGRPARQHPHQASSRSHAVFQLRITHRRWVLGVNGGSQRVECRRSRRAPLARWRRTGRRRTWVPGRAHGGVGKPGGRAEAGGRAGKGGRAGGKGRAHGRGGRAPADGRWRTGAGGRALADGRRRTGVGGRAPADRRRRTGAGGRAPADGRRRTGASGRAPADGRRRTGAGGRAPADGRRRTGAGGRAGGRPSGLAGADGRARAGGAGRAGRAGERAGGRRRTGTGGRRRTGTGRRAGGRRAGAGGRGQAGRRAGALGRRRAQRGRQSLRATPEGPPRSWVVCLVELPRATHRCFHRRDWCVDVGVLVDTWQKISTCAVVFRERSLHIGRLIAVRFGLILPSLCVGWTRRRPERTDLQPLRGHDLVGLRLSLFHLLLSPHFDQFNHVDQVLRVPLLLLHSSSEP